MRALFVTSLTVALARPALVGERRALCTVVLVDVWVYLSTTPLLGLAVTLLVYQGAFMLYRRSGFHPLANPVALISLCGSTRQ